MFNEFLSTEEGKAHRQQYMEEAEAYRQDKQLGYGHSKIARWVLVLVILFIAITIIY